MRIDNFLECVILRRLNRFVVEVEVGGRVERAYINNTGRLEELLFRGNRGHCTRKSGGKTSFRLFAVECEGGYALIDTRFQMLTFEENLHKLSWIDTQEFKRDIRVDGAVIDYLIDDTYVEVKSAALKVGKFAMYPDCPTERGRKHVRVMSKLVRGGKRAVILFIAAVPKVEAFRPNKKADPELHRLLVRAKKIGVELKAVRVEYSDGNTCLTDPDLPVML